MVRFAVAVLSACALSAGWAMYATPDFVGSAWFVAVAKLTVCLGYLVYFSSRLRDRFALGDFDVVHWWATAALWSAILGVTGYLLFRVGIETPLVRGPRATALFEDPNAYAGFLVASIPLVVASDILGGHGPRLGRIALVAAAVLASESRAGVVSLLVVCLCGLLLTSRYPEMSSIRRRGLAAATCLTVAAYVSGVRISAGRRDTGPIGEDIRFRLWDAAAAMWAENPIFGIGLGQFPARLEDYAHHNVEGELLTHNSYLAVLSELGVVGAVAVFGLPAVVLVARCRSRTLTSRLVGAALVGVYAHAFSVNLLNIRYFWVLLAIGIAWKVSVKAPTKFYALEKAGPGTHRSFDTPRKERVSRARSKERPVSRRAWNLP